MAAQEIIERGIKADAILPHGRSNLLVNKRNGFPVHCPQLGLYKLINALEIQILYPKSFNSRSNTHRTERIRWLTRVKTDAIKLKPSRR
jgi:hypothetical protein